MANDNNIKLSKQDYGYKAIFFSMASHCEILINSFDKTTSRKISKIAFNEAKRIETKYSRYIDNNIVDEINSAKGKKIKLDKETQKIINYANSCYELSESLFDISSGVLRYGWDFTKHDFIPDDEKIKSLLKLVGWHKVKLECGVLQMPANMQLDFGGIGKEYAVDKILLKISEKFSCPVLVNLGGDLSANAPPIGTDGWKVALEESPDKIFNLTSGAIATSGDKNRYVIYKGERLTHILNPKTGWPIKGAPSSVTVKDSTCIEAGFIATMAILHGSNAKKFLNEQKVKWVIQGI